MRPTIWTALQVAVVATTVTLLIGLTTVPKTTLAVFWNVVVPVLPAIFLVAPSLWRNVCPLATLNMLGSDRIAHRISNPRMTRASFAIGIFLFVLLVPARHFLFNLNGPVLSIVILAVLLLAFMLGTLFRTKAGFCNAICPLLPVERLYSQRPMFQVVNARCAQCSLCAPLGCIDLVPTNSIAHTFGMSRKSNAWLFSVYGIFAGAFPGFVIGYYTLQDSPLGRAAVSHVYAHVVLSMAVSWVLTALAVTALRIHWDFAMSAIAAISFALYYWYASPLVAMTLGMPQLGPIVIRTAAGVLIAAWSVAYVRSRQRPLAGKAAAAR